jgi:hypothetical protein
MAALVFADDSAVANPDGDLIKVRFTARTGDGQTEPTGTLILTHWASLQLAASLFEALKRAGKQQQATVIDMKKARRVRAKLAKEPALQ